MSSSDKESMAELVDDIAQIAEASNIPDRDRAVALMSISSQYWNYADHSEHDFEDFAEFAEHVHKEYDY